MQFTYKDRRLLCVKERVVVYLRVNLDSVEISGMPKWTETGFYALDVLPSKERWVDGLDVLVWSGRENKRFIYVGLLRNTRLVAGGISFERFERLKRPVVIWDEAREIDDTENYLKKGGGFFNDFSYVSEAVFENVLKHSERPAENS